MPQQPQSDTAIDPTEALNSRDFLRDWTELGKNPDPQKGRLEQANALRRIVPEFSSLPPEEQDKFMLTLSNRYNSMSAEGGLSAPTEFFKGVGQSISNMVKGGVINVAKNLDQGRLPLGPDALLPAEHPEELVMQPIRELFGIRQPGESVTTAQGGGFHPFNFLASLMGGDPVARRAADAEGNEAKGLGLQYGVPLLTAGIGRLWASRMKEPALPTRRNVNSMETLQGGRGVMSGDPIQDALRQGELQKLWQQSALEQGITDDTIRKQVSTRDRAGSQKDIVGDVRRGNSTVLKIVNNAVDIAQRPLDSVMQVYGSSPAWSVGLDISQSLMQQAAEIGEVNPPLRNAIEALAKKIGGTPKTFSELNKIKVHANKMAEDLYSHIPGREISGTAETAYAYRLAANIIREKMYPVLQRMSGGNIDLSALGRREADAISARDAVYDTYYRQVAPRAASQGAASFLGYVFGGTDAPSHSLYSRHILARAAEKGGMVSGPGGAFNLRARQGLGKIGKGTVPERVTVGTRNIPALPGGTEPFRFTISGDLPQEIITGRGVVPAQKVHLGTREVVGSAEGAATDTALFQQARRELGEGASISDVARRAQELKAGMEPNYPRQRQELGTTAETIPENVRGHRTLEQIRRQQLGAGGGTVPARSFTGPMSHREDMWQYLTSGTETGETSRIQGPGTLSTSSLKTAQETLGRLKQFSKQSMPAPMKTRVQNEIASLEKQLKDYHAYDQHVRPTDVRVSKFRPGTRQVSGARRKALTRSGALGRGARGLTPPPSMQQDQEPKQE